MCEPLYTTYRCMGEKIRLGEDTHDTLAALKGDEETFEDVIQRLLERRKERIRKGAGYWDEADAETARERLEELREGVGRSASIPRRR